MKTKISTPGRHTSPIYVETTPGRPTSRSTLETTPGRPTKNTATTIFHPKSTRYRNTDPSNITTGARTTNRIITPTPKYSGFRTRYPSTGVPS